MYYKIAENIINEVITGLSDNISSIPSFPQKHPSEENRNDMQMFGAYQYIKEKHTYIESEGKNLEINSSKELPDVYNGQNMEDKHTTLDSSENDLVATGIMCDKKGETT